MGSKKNIKKNRKFKVAKPHRHYDYFSQMPCGRCPVIHMCAEGADISPENCDYYTKWLAQGTDNTHGTETSNEQKLPTSNYGQSPRNEKYANSSFGGADVVLSYDEENEDDEFVLEGRFNSLGDEGQEDE